MKVNRLGWAGAVCAALFMLPLSAFAECVGDKVELRGDWGQTQFKVEVADTPQERAQGLMNRSSMPRNAGMIFFFEKPGSVAFWMKNTLIPLDMIFVDPSGVVKHVHVNAIPHDETPIPGGDGILAVLEINGGLSEVYNIGVGTQLRHPMFAQEAAAWPC